MQNFWKNKKVLVAGGTGFIGSFVTELLVGCGAHVTVTTRSGQTHNISHILNRIQVKKADLFQFAATLDAINGSDVVLNLAGRVAGIDFNRKHPALMFRDNVLINHNIIEAARRQKVERLLVISSGCVYSREVDTPISESQGFVDDPEPTNLGYGWSKRVAELFGRLYSQEFSMKVAIARPFNTYGPRDDFNPVTSHVIPGLIRRVLAGENPLVVWGSGMQTRSFIYAEDFARGLLEITEKYAVADPVNLSSDEEITIEDLAKLIIKLSGKRTRILLDKTKPDGQPRRFVDTTKAKAKIGFATKISLAEGLERTIKWYAQHLLS